MVGTSTSSRRRPVCSERSDAAAPEYPGRTGLHRGLEPAAADRPVPPRLPGARQRPAVPDRPGGGPDPRSRRSAGDRGHVLARSGGICSQRCGREPGMAEIDRRLDCGDPDVGVIRDAGHRLQRSQGRGVRHPVGDALRLPDSGERLLAELLAALSPRHRQFRRLHARRRAARRADGRPDPAIESELHRPRQRPALRSGHGVPARHLAATDNGPAVRIGPAAGVDLRPAAAGSGQQLVLPRGVRGTSRSGRLTAPETSAGRWSSKSRGEVFILARPREPEAWESRR